MMHSAFAFLMVQGILKDFANISIVKEVFFAFGFCINTSSLFLFNSLALYLSYSFMMYLFKREKMNYLT